MDGHGSHITGKLIAACICKSIDLLIMPPHCSHVLQPLDVGVFGPLKKFHSQEVDKYSRQSISRITRNFWVDIYIQIRARAFTKSNIQAAWKGSGLVPYNRSRVLRNLPGLPPPSTPPPATPNVYILPGMDLSALNSSPPSGTQLRESNRVFNESISTLISTPTRRYASRMTTLLEKQTTKVILLEKELQEARELAQKRKKRTGKRIKLEGEFVFSTASVLKIVEEAEAATLAKKKGKKAQLPVTELIVYISSEEEGSGSNMGDSEDDWDELG